MKRGSCRSSPASASGIATGPGRARLGIRGFSGVLGALGAAMAMTACAAPREATGMRIVVTLVQPSADGAAIAKDAERAAGVPVRHIAALGPLQHALMLSCDPSITCEAALQRLRAQKQRFAEVASDERRFRH